MSMVGKFFVESNGDYFGTGQIIDEVSGDCFLVEYDMKEGHTGPTPKHLVHISEMTTATDDMKDWSFFDSMETLQEWKDWHDSPDSPKVVNLVRK